MKKYNKFIKGIIRHLESKEMFIRWEWNDDISKEQLWGLLSIEFNKWYENPLKNIYGLNDYRYFQLKDDIKRFLLCL